MFAMRCPIEEVSDIEEVSGIEDFVCREVLIVDDSCVAIVS